MPLERINTKNDTLVSMTPNQETPAGAFLNADVDYAIRSERTLDAQGTQAWLYHSYDLL